VTGNLTFADRVRVLESSEGAPPDERTDVDTRSLVACHPELSCVQTRDVEIPGPVAAVPARLYRAPGAARAGLVWVHGGAFVGGDLDMPEANWVALTIAARRITTLSVDYRKALHGTTFPAPSDDVLAAWSWATSHLSEFRVPASAVHLGGASAGASLSAGVAARVRDSHGAGPASLILVYATVHPTLPHNTGVRSAAAALAGHERDRRQHHDDMARHYAGTHLADPYAFPGLGDARGLPPTYLLNSEVDDLRASAQAFAAKIALAGGTIRSEYEPGSTHGHLDRPHEAQGRRSIERIIRWIENQTGPAADQSNASLG
jgi:acetyl esterase